MGNKRKHESKRKIKKKRARYTSTSSSASDESGSTSRTPPSPPATASRARKRNKVSNKLDTGTVSTNTVTLHNMIPDFDPLKDNVVSWLQIIESYAATFSWTDNMIRYQALNKLKGSAKVWYESLLRNDLTWTTWVWENWKRKISQTFRVKRNMFELLKDIVERKPCENQSLYDFFFEQKSRIDSLCLNFSDFDIISIILGNIGDNNITASVEASNFESCDSLAGFLHSRVYKSKNTKQPFVNNSLNVRDNNNNNKVLSQSTNTVSQTSITTNLPSTSTSQNNSNQTQNRKTIGCYTCGGNHKRINCNVKCEFCGKRGHSTTMCYYKKNSKETSDKQEIKFVQSSNTKNKFFKRVKINGITHNAFIDTGSSCSIIKSDLVNKQNMKRIEMTTPVMLQGFSKDNFKVVKEFVRIDLTLDSVKICGVDMYILDELTGCDILIGRNVLTECIHA